MEYSILKAEVLLLQFFVILICKQQSINCKEIDFIKALVFVA